MKKSLLRTILYIFIIGFANLTWAGGDHPGKIADDSALLTAIHAHQNVFYLETANLTVIRLLPDDTTGRMHQKWLAQWSDGSQVAIIYNTDIGDRVESDRGAV